MHSDATRGQAASRGERGNGRKREEASTPHTQILASKCNKNVKSCVWMPRFPEIPRTRQTPAYQVDLLRAYLVTGSPSGVLID